MAKKMRKQREYHRKLAEQLELMENACQAFDAGSVVEGLNIAIRIRLLLHHTGQTPLIELAGGKNVRLLSTCAIKTAKELDRIHFLGGWPPISLTSGGPTFVPKRETGEEMYLTTEEWWQQVMWVLGPSVYVKRRDIVLGAANKDGGAHVASRLKSGPYKQLREPGSTLSGVKWRNGRAELFELTSEHLYSLRQMALEILESPDLLRLASHHDRPT